MRFDEIKKTSRRMSVGGMWGSNPRHSEPQSDALPTELRPPCMPSIKKRLLTDFFSAQVPSISQKRVQRYCFFLIYANFFDFFCKKFSYMEFCSSLAGHLCVQLLLPKRRSDIFPSLPYSLVESLVRLFAFQTAERLNIRTNLHVFKRPIDCRQIHPSGVPCGFQREALRQLRHFLRRLIATHKSNTGDKPLVFCHQRIQKTLIQLLADVLP